MTVEDSKSASIESRDSPISVINEVAGLWSGVPTVLHTRADRRYSWRNIIIGSKRYSNYSTHCVTYIHVYTWHSHKHTRTHRYLLGVRSYADKYLHLTRCITTVAAAATGNTNIRVLWRVEQRDAGDGVRRARASGERKIKNKMKFRVKKKNERKTAICNNDINV